MIYQAHGHFIVSGSDVEFEKGQLSAPQVLVLDAFTDADATALNAHAIAPTNIPATAWTHRVGTWSILTNRARCGTPVDTAWNIATCTPGKADVALSVSAVLAAANQYGPALIGRFQDTNNYWICVLASDAGNTYVQIREINGGASTTRASTTIARVANGSTVALSATFSGQSISFTYGVTTVTWTSASFLAQTIHGIGEYRQVGAPRYDGNSFDNFQAFG